MSTSKEEKSSMDKNNKMYRLLQKVRDRRARHRKRARIANLIKGGNNVEVSRVVTTLSIKDVNQNSGIKIVRAGSRIEPKRKEYVASDIQYKTNDKKEIQDILIWVNDPNNHDTKRKEEVLKYGPEGALNITRARIRKQWNSVNVFENEKS